MLALPFTYQGCAKFRFAFRVFSRFLDDFRFVSFRSKNFFSFRFVSPRSKFTRKTRKCTPKDGPPKWKFTLSQMTILRKIWNFFACGANFFHFYPTFLSNFKIFRACGANFSLPYPPLRSKFKNFFACGAN